MTGTYPTLDGGSIEVQRVGLVVDMHVRNSQGHSVATHEVTESVARLLLDGLKRELAA